MNAIISVPGNTARITKNLPSTFMQFCMNSILNK